MNSKRLLIVDNEHIVVDSLLYAFEKKPELHLDVCGAYSADEALSLMERAKVDILLTDIKMPGMNGLDLQREVAGRWPWCRTLFLTGYNDFAFAQEAIRLGGVEYLLKTEGTDAIIAAVERTAAQIDGKRKNDELLQNAEALVAQAQPLLQHKLLLSLINGWTDTRSALDQFARYAIPLSQDNAWQIFVRLDDVSETDSLGYDMVLAAMESVTTEYLGQLAHFVQVEFTRGTLVWLVSFDQGLPENRRLVYLQGVTEAVQQHLESNLGLHISACISREPVKWADMPGRLQRLMILLNRAMHLGGGDGAMRSVLLTEMQEPHTAEVINETIRHQLDGIQRMDAYLENGNHFNFQSVFVELVQTLADSPVTARLEAYHSVLAVLIKQINRGDLLDIVMRKFELSVFEPRMNWNERMQALWKFSDAVYEAKRLCNAQAGDDLIARVRRYIDNNLGCDLSFLQIGEKGVFMRKHFSLFVALCFLFCATALPALAEEPIVITVGRSVSPTQQYLAGEDLNNNIWYREYLNALNIRIEHDWTVMDSEYATKLNLAIASGQIPNIIRLETQSQLNDLVNAGLVADITDVYAEYASDATKKLMAGDGGLAIDMCTYDGRLMALPYLDSTVYQISLLWIRQDWLDNLGLQVPTTMAELANVAYAFTHNDPDQNGIDDTKGIAFSDMLFEGTTSLIGFFNGYHAYPQRWLVKDNAVAYGSVQPEMKDGLAALADMYTNGLIDTDFAVKDTGKVCEEVKGKKFGMLFGYNWTNYPTGSSEDPWLGWTVTKAPGVDGGEVLYSTGSSCSSFYVVSNECKNPEALVQMMNLYIEMEDIRIQHNCVHGGAYGHRSNAIRGGQDRRRESLTANKVRNNTGNDADHRDAGYIEPW